MAEGYARLLGVLLMEVPSEPLGLYHVYHRYMIRVSLRDELASFLKERGIGTMVYYRVPLHRQPVFTGVGYERGSLPSAETACDEVLSLPISPAVSDAQQRQVAGAISEFYGGRMSRASLR